MPEERAPLLETPRLLLRGHTVDDLADCAGMWADPAVARFIGGKAMSREEVWSKILRYAGHWALCGFGYWIVRERATGRFVGEVGLADFRRELSPSFGGAPEAGWALASSAHGKGLATEAVRAALGWFEAERGRARTVCLIDPDNAASIRVAVKCGYREWTRTTYKGETVILFER